MAEEYILVKNNGVGFIHQQNIPNCCIFIALGVIWKYVSREDYNLHEEVFKNTLSREISPEEMVYSILKIKSPDVIATLGETQIDTLLENFVKYTNIKLSVVLAGTEMKWDLYEGSSPPDGVIVQYPNHYDCAIPKKYMDKN
jgi:hypothetical protein